MLIRKKSLKMQERLGMKIGVTYGVSTIPVAKTIDQTIEVMRELYKVGFRALVLPPDLFAGIKDTTDLYKDAYGDLLRLKNIAKKFGIELSLRQTDFGDMPDNSLRIFSTIASVMDCRVFVISPGFYPRMPQSQALRLVVHKINEIINELRVKAKIGIETSGRPDDLGSVEDVIEICKRTTNTCHKLGPPACKGRRMPERPGRLQGHNREGKAGRREPVAPGRILLLLRDKVRTVRRDSPHVIRQFRHQARLHDKGSAVLRDGRNHNIRGARAREARR